MSQTLVYLQEESRTATLGNPLTVATATTAAAVETLREDGEKFKRAYFRDVQRIFSRVQHHMHKKTKKGYVPLKACARKGRGAATTCKHDFPKTLFGFGKAALICRGLARRCSAAKLRVSGRRNSLGLMILPRRDAWQSGTMPAFAAGFRSNMHTAPNWRLPPIQGAHADDLCRSKVCHLQSRDPQLVKVVAKVTQKAQRNCTGCFCGYTFKPQPTGKKCLKGVAESLNYLTTGMEDKRPGQQWHRITHRVLTDLQHRAMRRTAPEEWNLAAYHHDQDPTSAEFVRTYESADFPGGVLLRRLESEMKGSKTRTVSKVMPAPSPAGNEGLMQHFDDLYGYRGSHPGVWHLSPWEFLALWEVVSTAHEVQIDPREKDRVAYSVIDGNVQLRNHFHMRRRAHPKVPAPSHTRLPQQETTRDGKARLYSLYLRPWVLDGSHASQWVPHLGNLNYIAGRRRTAKRVDQLRTSSRRSFAVAWSQYIRGNVVSTSACRIIVQFMAANCGRSRRDEDDSKIHGDTATNQHVPDADMAVQRIHGIIDRMSTAEVKVGTQKAAAGANEPGDVDHEADACALQQSSQINDAMKLTAKLWSRTKQGWDAENLDTATVATTVFASYSQRNTHNRKKQRKPLTALQQQSGAYIIWKERDIGAWRLQLQHEAEPPTPEQGAFLDAVIGRCREESRAFKSTANEAFHNEPLRCCLFGIPGAGKSKCLKLVRRFFEECLAWEDGVQFQYLASQNTMAALVGGATVHSWSTIPVNATDAAEKVQTKGKDGDVDELFTKCLGMRWLLIDEVSTLSPYLLGLLDAYVRRACCRHPYAKVNGHRRAFGGLNLGMAGDLWQLTPVRSFSIFSNPYLPDYSSEEQIAFKMFWRPSDTHAIY